MGSQNSHRQRGTLLASFVLDKTDEEILSIVEALIDKVDLTNNMIFLLEDVKDPQKKILTYNVSSGSDAGRSLGLFTMRIHRKKNTNTLYTINALNLAVALDNDGKTGKEYKLDWDKYTNSLLLAINGSLVVHNVEVAKIFKIEPPSE